MLEALSPNVSLFKANLSQPSTLKDAFTGATVVYGMTNYYDAENVADGLNEARQGCAMVDIAKEAGVQLFIWSTIPSALLRSAAQFDSPRLVENKFTISQYLKYRKVPHVDLHLGFYMDNWLNFGQVAEGKDGVVEIAQPRMKPETKIGMVYLEKDLGPVVDGILSKFFEGEDILGQAFYCVSALQSTNDFCETVQRELGVDARVLTPPTTGFKDLDIMYDFYNVWGVYRDIEIPHPETLSLVGKLSTMSDFVTEQVAPFLKSLQ
jgi:hypothetical protein